MAPQKFGCPISSYFRYLPRALVSLPLKWRCSSTTRSLRGQRALMYYDYIIGNDTRKSKASLNWRMGGLAICSECHNRVHLNIICQIFILNSHSLPKSNVILELMIKFEQYNLQKYYFNGIILHVNFENVNSRGQVEALRRTTHSCFKGLAVSVGLGEGERAACCAPCSV